MNITQLLKKVAASFSHLLFPAICIHCQQPLEERSLIFCQICLQQLQLIDPESRCPYCFSFDFDPQSESYCQTCHNKPQSLHRIAAAFDYEGPAASLIKQMKYGGQSYLAEGAGSFLVAQYVQLEWPTPDFIIPMPMAPLRKIERGYNQSHLLAEVVARTLGRPLLDIIKRKSGDFSQAGLNYQQRLRLREDAFLIKTKENLKDKTILLIDDVMTTGSTLRRCGEALFEHYPEHIYALTVCRAI